MKNLILLPCLFFSSCAAFDNAIETAGVVAPPIADAVQPGLGTPIGIAITGVSIIGGAIASVITIMKKKAKL